MNCERPTNAHGQPADPRVIRTREAISGAFRKLIAENDASKINVKAITDEAHINRKTFYLHFECIEDLYKWTCDEIVDGYAAFKNALNPVGEPINDHEIAARTYYRTFYEYFAQLKPWAEKIMCDPSYSQWSDYVIKSCAALNRRNEKNMLDLTENERKLFDRLYVSEMTHVYRRWVKLGKDIDVDEVVNFSMKVLYHGMSAIFK